MPDVALVVGDISSPEEAENVERALMRLDPVNLVNVDSEKGLVAVSYDGGETELETIHRALREAGHGAESSPGSDNVGG